MTLKLPMMIAMRGYAVPVHDDDNAKKKEGAKSKHKRRKGLSKPCDEIVVFDTETKIDHSQHLRIGTYQVRKGMTLHEKGIFYEPNSVTPDELILLNSYAKAHGLVLRTREEFVRDVLYLYGYDHGGLILGFNLPFDLSRLATAISTSHGKDMRGGFSLELLDVKWRCNPLVKHLNSRAAFMRFAAPPMQSDARGMRKKWFKTAYKPGYFQELGRWPLHCWAGLSRWERWPNTSKANIENSILTNMAVH